MLNLDEATRFQIGGEGPIQIARIWLEAVVRDKDLRAAWPITHPELRGDLVDGWFRVSVDHPGLEGRDVGDVRRVLTSPAPEDQLWEDLERILLIVLEDYWSFVDLDSWTCMTDLRPHGPDTELVQLIDVSQLDVKETADGWYEIPAGTRAPSTSLVMKLLDKDSEEDDGALVSLVPSEENRWRVSGW